MIWYGTSSRLTVDGCNDCGNETDVNDAAPSCGAHILCCSCWETSDFRCRECRRVWDELARAEAW